MKKLNVSYMVIAAVCIFSLLSPSPTLGEVVKLKEGTWINGKIIKQTPKLVFIDLGHDILRIPRSEILEISDQLKINSTTQSQATEEQHPLYTAKNLDFTSTTDGVNEFEEAVVLVRSPGGQGSGFLVNKQGYIVTNYHVIHGQKHINVTRYKQMGKEQKRIVHKDVRIVALDPFHDLAVLQLEKNIADLSPPTILSPGDDVVTGEKIFVIGNPMGLERTVTEGVVSHTGRLFAGKVYLQLDAAINPGNSGGPLFNSRGQVIGVINMGARFMQGLNFAIPVRHVKFLLSHVDAYAYNEANPVSGYVYPFPPRNPNRNASKKRPNKKNSK